MLGALASSLLIVSACSNSGKKEASSPAHDLLVGLAESNQVENTGSAGQNFAAIPTTAPTTHVISKATKFSSRDYGVQGSPRVTTGKEVRKGGGRYQVGKPYTIRGIRYVPREQPGYNRIGLASWYGPNFHGRLTANGEVYDQHALSAAHPTMPLPSYAKVTNMENGASVIVRVNDRGPFSKSRIIDLSSRAANLLGYTKQGVAKVRVEYAGKARMDGLDESYLVASYNPGSLNPGNIPGYQPNVVVAGNTPQNAPLPVARPKSSVGTRVTLSALDQEEDYSLINGYAAQNARSSIFSGFDSPAYQIPKQGMHELMSLTLGPFNSGSKADHAENTLSKFGPVSRIKDTQTSSISLRLTTLSDDLPRVMKTVRLSGYSELVQDQQ